MMETDNDVVIVDSGSNDPLGTSLKEHEGKPLMMLFRRLIGNDSKQNTVLTNAQIVDILQKEFNMDIVYIHELEIDIYLNILKKFLKDWPQWDEFDTAINMLKSQNENEKINEMLECNYQSLKAYLQTTLKSVEPLVTQTIKEVREGLSNNIDVEDNVVMHLQCTRQQLNKLFYRRPHPDLRNTIFNIPDTTLLKINVSSLRPEQLLNWPDIRICFSCNNTVFRREVSVSVKHVLVNKKLDYIAKTPEELKPNFLVKGTDKQSINLESFIEVINKYQKAKFISQHKLELVQTVCMLLKSDLESGPLKLEYPAVYRKYLTKYPLRRYLYSEVDASAGPNVNNYDLQLEETGVPQLYFGLTRFQGSNGHIPASSTSIKIDCMSCKFKFKSANLLEEVKQHLQEYHHSEPDWHCTKCGRTLPMNELTRTHYRHNCE